MLWETPLASAMSCIVGTRGCAAALETRPTACGGGERPCVPGDQIQCRCGDGTWGYRTCRALPQGGDDINGVIHRQGGLGDEGQFSVRRQNRKVQMALGPTHEEVVTDLVAQLKADPVLRHVPALLLGSIIAGAVVLGLQTAVVILIGLLSLLGGGGITIHSLLDILAIAAGACILIGK